MSADEGVLGAILRDNNVAPIAMRAITGSDFANPSLGAVFDGLCSSIMSGAKIDVSTIEIYLPRWGVLAVGPEQPWIWIDQGDPIFVRDLADAVRAASLRRRGRKAMTDGLRDLNDAGQDPATVLERVNRSLVGHAHAELDSVPLSKVLETPDEENWVIPGLMERMDRLILTGHEGLGKTTLARQLLILPAAGIQPFTLERIDPVRALVIDAENTAKQWMRAARAFVGRADYVGIKGSADRIEMALSGRVDILNPSTLGGIHRLIDSHKPDVVFIGPLYRIAVHMNTDEQVAPVIAALDTIRDRGVALIIEAHAGHAIGPGGVRDVRPRGSSALLGWPEFGFGIRKSQEIEAGPRAFDFVAWRGARESRDWPEMLIRGDWSLGDWPWVARMNELA